LDDIVKSNVASSLEIAVTKMSLSSKNSPQSSVAVITIIPFCFLSAYHGSIAIEMDWLVSFIFISVHYIFSVTMGASV